MLALDLLTGELTDNTELFEMSEADEDEAGLVTIEGESAKLALEVEKLEFRRMFNNPADPLNCFLDIQAGAGGTEACDWASMLLRQYLRYAERKGFKTSVDDETPGDVAGIKGATIHIEGEAGKLRPLIEELEFRRMFRHEADPLNCFVDIQAGAGGTEACDWASMLLRQYLKYAERKGFKATVEDETPGDVAGIKSATIKIEGEYAYGLLRTETGVHRLVRKSPFDSSGGRHTSFSSLFVYPEIDDSIEININPADVRTDTYRASGAGGQHINKTDSAVRLTHIPTGIVVQCQDGRSQHSNRDVAWQRLRSRLYDFEMRKRMEEQQKLEDTKTDVGWGHQIRSYVLDNSRIKDLRTNVEVSATQKVLDGDLDVFIEASLKQGL